MQQRDAHPIEILESLMENGPANASQHALFVSQDFWAVDEQEKIESTTRQFIAKYESVCELITEKWGTADYVGSWSDSGFPDWSDDTLLSYWHKGDVLAYAAFRHDDKELPMMVVVGIR